MAIDRLSGTSGLIAALRAEMSRKSERGGRKSPGQVHAGREAPARSRDVSVLRRELATILADVDENDPTAMDAARPRVVRSVLLWEFGGDLREHPQWQPILDNVANTLADSEAHRSQFAQMVKDMRRGPRR